jgi:putative Holliday junction resolvase
MSRIIAIDYGGKRTGLAVSDPLKIIAQGLTTIPSAELIDFLKQYFSKENVEMILVGLPKNLDDSPTHMSSSVEQLVIQLKKQFPDKPVKTLDERFTSKLASKAMVDMGMKKRQRQDKALVDEIAATILLQDYLQQANNY